MKICFVIDDYSATGGIQRVTSIIASGLAIKNDVHVISLYNQFGNSNLDKYDKKISIKVLFHGSKEYIKQSLKAVSLIRKYIDENSLDVLIATSEMMSPYCYLSTIGKHIPFLCWTHTPALNNVEAKTQKIFKFLGVKKAKYTIALTEKTKKELSKKYHKDSIVAIANPIDSKLLKEVKYDINSKKIITVGRICYQKYYEKLVEVAELFLKNYPEWTWHIFGDGVDEEKIKNMVKERVLESQIIFEGNVDNLYSLYKEYAIQVMASRFEGFPMTLLEGISNGLPIVSFDIDGANAIVENEKNGYLIKPFDEKEMANRIVKLIENNQLRKEFSNESLNSIEKYKVETIIEEWNELLNR